MSSDKGILHQIANAVIAVRENKDAIEDVLGANERELLLQGKLAVPLSAVRAGVVAALGDEVDGVELALTDHGFDVSFTVVSGWPKKRVHVVGSRQRHVAGPGALGSLGFHVEGDVTATGGLVARVVGGIALGILRWLYGDALVLEALNRIDGVVATDTEVSVELDQLSPVRRAVEGSKAVALFSGLGRVTQVELRPDHIAVSAEPTDAGHMAIRAWRLGSEVIQKAANASPDAGDEVRPAAQLANQSGQSEAAERAAVELGEAATGWLAKRLAARGDAKKD